MPQVVFTSHLRRWVDLPETPATGTTVAEALGDVFTRAPQLRGYILDDRHALRPHIAIFIDGSPIRDRRFLTDPLRADSEIYVMQALSGG